MKTYEYKSKDGFFMGRMQAKSAREVRRFLRELFGLRTYLKIRNKLQIRKVKGWD